MTLRHRPRFARTALARTALARVAIGTAASLAVVASTGVSAGAVEDVTIDDPDATSQAPTETPQPTEEAPVDDIPAPPAAEPLAEDPAATVPPAAGPSVSRSAEVAEVAEAPSVALAPNYGSQKVRVGVQLADGSWVPEGTTLLGSTVRVTLTGGVDGDDEPLPEESFECVTGDEFFDDGTTSSSCDLEGPFGLLFLSAGRTLTVQHLSSPAGIGVNPVPLVVEPCETTGPAGSPCSGGDPFASVDALVEVTGTKPTANPDAATTPFNTAIVIDVLANDDSGNGAPVTGLSIAEQPANGTAEVIGELSPVVDPDPEPEPEPELPELELLAAPEGAAAAAAAPSSVQVRYTPNAGFVGFDTFVYAVSTPNGTSFATVTVQVLGAASPAVVSPTRTGVLPNVGGSDATLLGLGALLVTAGAATIAAGRRRAEVRDVLA